MPSRRRAEPRSRQPVRRRSRSPGSGRIRPGCGACLRPVLDGSKPVRGGSLVHLVAGLVKVGTDLVRLERTEATLPALTAADFSFTLRQELPPCLQPPQGKILFAGCREQTLEERLLGYAPRVWALIAPPLGRGGCREMVALAGTTKGALTMFFMRAPTGTKVEDVLFQKIHDKLAAGYVENSDCAAALLEVLQGALKAGKVKAAEDTGHAKHADRAEDAEDADEERESKHTDGTSDA